MSWRKVKLAEVLKQYRVEHLVQDSVEYKQVTISKHDGVCFRGYKKGKDIGRKRQFIIDLKKYPNTLMFVRQGVEDGSIGIVPPEVDGCIATENMPMFSVENIDIQFLRLLIQSSYFKDEVAKIQTTGSAQKSIHERQLLEIEIPLPSPKEQSIIVSALSTFSISNDALHSELTEQQDLVKQLRQAFLKEAMQGKLVKQDEKEGHAKKMLQQIKSEKARSGKVEKELPTIKPEEIPFEIPDNWVWCRWDEICDSRLGKMLDGIKNKGDFYPYLRNLNVQWYQIKMDDVLQMKFEKSELEEYSVKKGDLLICEGGYPGRAAIWELEDESYKFQKALHRVRFYGNISAKFYLYYLDLVCSSGKIKDYFTGSGIQHLTGKSLKQMPVPLSSISEQYRVVKKLEELLQLCDELQQSIEQSKQQNEMLLQQVLREALQPKEVEAV